MNKSRNDHKEVQDEVRAGGGGQQAVPSAPGGPRARLGEDSGPREGGPVPSVGGVVGPGQLGAGAVAGGALRDPGPGHEAARGGGRGGTDRGRDLH